jgi:acetoin utilization protein AcuB
MKVKDVMTTAPVTITPDTPISEARHLMQKHAIRHLPVLEDERLVGMLSDRDLRTVAPSPATSLSVWEINHLLTKLTSQRPRALCWGTRSGRCRWLRRGASLAF